MLSTSECLSIFTSNVTEIRNEFDTSQTWV